MSIADELRKLEELRRSGALTDEEFARAKAKVLAADAAPRPDDDTLREHLAELRRENELARLDREWQIERERYQMTGRNGYRYTPSRIASVVMGVVAVGFGVFWTVMAAEMAGGFGGGPAAFFPLFGVLFILIGIGMSVFSFLRASQYDEARRRYERRRTRLLSGEDEDGDPEWFVTAGARRGEAGPASTDIQNLSDPTPCLRCGRAIPAGQGHCPHCGWSYS
jgi:Short C-terminal domain